ncbi:MAG: DUF6457 domain-containing protein [Corynebacterium sp.]|nr:DUF6457 domain-containing protein [Corynebacterium sp.]
MLDLTKEVAHSRARPAGPLAAFLVGYASSSPQEARENIAKLMEALGGGEA